MIFKKVVFNSNKASLKRHLFRDDSSCNLNQDPVFDSWFALFVSIGIALSLLVGFSFVLFRFGVTISRWHFLVYGFILVACLVVMFPRQWRRIGLLGLLQFGVHALSIVVVSMFCDLGVDGMGTHQEGVLAFTSEWNPVKDPYFAEAAHLKCRYSVVRDSFWAGRGMPRNFGYIISAVICKFTGVHESGKAIHLLAMWMGFCGSMSFACVLFRRFWNRLVFGLISGLNPVIGYQFLSYWQDGFLAGVYTSLLFCGVIWVIRPHRLSAVMLFLLLGFLMAGLKVSGLGFAGLTSFSVYLALVCSRKWPWRWLIPVGLVNLLLISFGGILLGAWSVHLKGIDPIVNRIEHFASDEISAGGSSFNQVLDYQGMNRLLVFICAMSSRTRTVPYEMELKLPFSFGIDELRVFYNFFGDPRAGGFGVLFSGLLLLGLYVYVVYFHKNARFSLFVLAVLMVMLLPLLFVPTYWARWIPHAWLIPLVMILPAWVDHEARYVRSSKRICFFLPISWRLLSPFNLVVAVLSLFLLNIALIFVPYTVGNAFGTYVLGRQIELLEILDPPLKIGNGDYPSNRNWLIQKGYDYEFTWDPEDWKKPYIQFYCTDTRVFVDPEDLARVTSLGITLEVALVQLQHLIDRWQPGQWRSEVLVNPCPQYSSKTGMVSTSQDD